MPSKPVREPIATWWRIEMYNGDLAPLRVVSFSECFVTWIDHNWPSSVRERCERRDDIFPTFAEAKAEAIRRSQERIKNLINQLHRERAALAQWESMKEPTDAGK